MKSLTLIALILVSFSAIASDCTIKAKARMKGYPLAFDFQKTVVDAVDLEDCKNLAALKLGNEYQSYVSLPGGLDSPGAYGYATFKVRKVKFSYVQDGVRYTGKIR